MAVVASLVRHTPEPSARDALMNKILQRCDVLRGRRNLLRDGEKTGFVPRCPRKQMFDSSHEWEFLTEEEVQILAALVADGFMICAYRAPDQYSYNHLF